MAPKKKAQKVLLTDFLADTSTGRSWADEMDELPTAPAPRDPNEPSGGLGGSHLSRHEGNRYPDRDFNRRGGDRDGYDRPERAEVPVPDKPPYNAFVGNLSWEVGSSELQEFFGASNIVSVRIITDNTTGKPKGYCYIEFKERDALVAALDRSGREIGGRPVRVSVAEPPKEREDRTGGAWRREGPLPTADDNHRRTRGSSHQEYSTIDDADRGERMGFGSKFVPSSDATNMTRRTQSGRGFNRAEGGFESESFDRGERYGFGSKFVASGDEPRRDRDPPQRGSNFVPSRNTPGGSEDGHSASGGSMRKTSMLDRKATDGEPSAADSVSSWRRAKPAVPTESEVTPSAPSAAPATRRKLELAARTVNSSDGALTPPASNKPSPFGAAKPIDTAEREKAIQEKLDRERAEAATNAANKKPTSGLDGKSGSDTADITKSVSATDVTSARPAAPSVASKTPKPNPFGGANPVDTLQKELEIEQKLERQKAEKLKKEAVGSKEAAGSQAVAPPSQVETEQSKPSTRNGPSANTSNPWNQESSHGPRSQSGKSRTAWAPPSSKPTVNGSSAHPAPSITTAPAPNKPVITSPKSPGLSSFRKEGISFAALAKTAATTTPNLPVSAASSTANANPQSKAKPSTGPTKDDHQKNKSAEASSQQQPRTILKRVEGLEIQNEKK